jgi:hypothetical protein
LSFVPETEVTVPTVGLAVRGVPAPGRNLGVDSTSKNELLVTVLTQRTDILKDMWSDGGPVGSSTSTCLNTYLDTYRGDDGSAGGRWSCPRGVGARARDAGEKEKY